MFPLSSSFLARLELVTPYQAGASRGGAGRGGAACWWGKWTPRGKDVADLGTSGLEVRNGRSLAVGPQARLSLHLCTHTTGTVREPPQSVVVGAKQDMTPGAQAALDPEQKSSQRQPFIFMASSGTLAACLNAPCLSFST